MAVKDVTRYGAYLALDRAVKRIEAAGGELEDYAFRPGFSPDFWEGLREADIAEGNVPRMYQYGLLQLDLNDKTPTDEHGEYVFGEEGARLRQEAREEFIRTLVKLYPDTVISRSGGQAYAYWKFGHASITINIGMALCERVLVREEYEEVPDPKLLEEATANVPLVKRVKPIYEYRCNDAELLG